MKVLTIKEPWASLIINGYKEYEFRSWKTNCRGKILIHAGLTLEKDTAIKFKDYNLDYGKGEIIGEMGIESYFDEELSGENGYYKYQKDAYGYKIAGTPTQEKKAKNGYNIKLTIDSNIQMYLENAINTVLDKIKEQI